MVKRLLTPLLIFATFTVIAESINGRDAKPGEFPYIVSVQILLSGTYDHFCGGSILTPSWVLTAARCYGNDFDYQIVAGIIKLNATNPERQERHVVQFITPPDNITSLYEPNDIALAQLEAPLKLNKFVQPIQLPKNGSSVFGSATATGWGLRENYHVSNNLQTVELAILPDSVCEQNSSDYIKEQHLCISSDGKGICQLDSGGPFVQSGAVIGVILDNMKYCAAGVPDIFTKVSSFIDFIEKYIHPSN